MIIASLCMRGGSKGVPNKNTVKINNKYIFDYTLEALENSKLVNRCVISSDDLEIIQLLKTRVDEKFIFQRDVSLSKSNSNKWDVFKDLILNYENRFNVTPEYLIDLDVTVPQKKSTHIDRVVSELVKNKYQCVVTGYEPERNPYFNMMEKKSNGYEVCLKSKFPIQNRQESPKVLSISPSVFGFNVNSLFEFNHWSELRCNIIEIPRRYGIDIDDKLDLLLVKSIINDEK